jgi:transcriptional regulator with XRE-family HTH domain
MGRRLKLIREELKLNQKKFAAKLDIAASLISQIEMGHKNPSFNFLNCLMHHFQVSFDWLFYGIGEKFVKKKSGETVEYTDIDDISSIVWYLENSSFFRHCVMGLSAKILLENEEIIKMELERKRQKNKDHNEK